MVAPDKQMGREDLESFLNQQFPKSNEVNNLLEQITASKNAMEKAMGEEIPSFYGTISRYISQHTVNGISDWINSNGQVNTKQINRAAQTAKKVYELHKRQEQEAEQERKKQERDRNEFENTAENDIKEKLNQIDYNNLSLNDFKAIAENFRIFAENSTDKAFDQVMETAGKVLGIDEQVTELQKLWKRRKNSDYVLTEKDKNLFESVSPEVCDRFGIDKSKYEFNDKKMEDMAEYELKVFTAILANYKNNGILDESKLEEIFLSNPEAYKQYGELFDKKAILTIKSEALEKYCNDRINEAKNIQQKENFKENADEISADEIEDVFANMFEGMDDLAEQAEEMGFPAQEGEGYTTFFEDFEQALEQEGFGGVESEMSQVLEELEQGQVGQEVPMQEAGEISRDDVAHDEREQGEAVVGEAQAAREVVEQEVGSPTSSVGFIGQLQNAAKEEPNDYSQAPVEEAYQSPTLDNLEDDKKGGILGFFAKIKDAVQARFAKKPEQKRLNPSSEQRTDENGWTVTTYDGNGKDLVPRGTGLRNAMVRFAENTVGKLGKFVANNQRSSEPINTPYVIPTNVRSNEDKVETPSWELTNEQKKKAAQPVVPTKQQSDKSDNTKETGEGER